MTWNRKRPIKKDKALRDQQRKNRERRELLDEAQCEIDEKERPSMSDEQYDLLLKHQDGVCAICLKPETSLDRTKKKIKKLSVDHDHFTKRVRGLLCSRCNLAIGLLLDDPQTCRNAARYLEQEFRHG